MARRGGAARGGASSVGAAAYIVKAKTCGGMRHCTKNTGCGAFVPNAPCHHAGWNSGARRADMRGMTSEASPNHTPCPICGATSERAYRPFCSKRCADIDLHRWLSGSYAVPAVEADDDGQDEPADDGGSPH